MSLTSFWWRATSTGLWKGNWTKIELPHPFHNVAYGFWFQYYRNEEQYFSRAHAHAHTHAHAHIYWYIYICICIRIRMRMHTYTHRHTHTHKYTPTVLMTYIYIHIIHLPWKPLTTYCPSVLRMHAIMWSPISMAAILDTALVPAATKRFSTVILLHIAVRSHKRRDV